jgi:hypothetical protein
MIKDTLHHTKYYNNHINKPDFEQIAEQVFDANPVYNRVFGIFPAASIRDILNSLPSIFIIGGIFGTFVGIMRALPDLGGFDLNNIEAARATMDAFLVRISFSMNTSIVGIILSVTFNFLNSMWNTETLENLAENKYRACLNFIWNEAKAQRILKLSRGELEKNDMERAADSRESYGKASGES